MIVWKIRIKIFVMLAGLLTCMTDLAQLPAFQWAMRAGGSLQDIGQAIACDNNGNIIVTGAFTSPTMNFGPAIGISNNAAYMDFFVVKYDASGNALWARTAGKGWWREGTGAATNASGDVFVTGIFRDSSITFGNITLTNSNGRSRDIFIVKYNASGNVIWAIKAGGSGEDFSNGFTIDPSGNLLLTGSSDNLVYLQKYNPDGALLWEKTALGYGSGENVASDGLGNIYVSGNFWDKLVFNKDTLFNYGTSGDVFLLKYNAAGDLLWAKSGVGNKPDYCPGLTTDAGGNVIIAGYSESPFLSFGADTLIFTSGNSRELFLVKFSSAGNLLWKSSIHGCCGDYGLSIATDLFGNILYTGSFADSLITVGTKTLVNTFAGLPDAFLAEYDSTGNVRWALSAGGESYDYGTGVCTGGGSVIAVGRYSSSGLMGGFVYIPNEGYDDLYLLKLGDFPPILPELGLEKIRGVMLYPNPGNGSFTLKSEFPILQVEVFNSTGILVYSYKSLNEKGDDKTLLHVELGVQPPGIYVFQLISIAGKTSVKAWVFK